MTRLAILWNKKPTNWCGRQNAGPLKFDTKPSEAAFWEVFFLTFRNADRKELITTSVGIGQYIRQNAIRRFA